MEAVKKKAEVLPAWLTPGTPVFHIPSSTLFIADRAIKRHKDKAIVLIDSKGEGNQYPLSECRKPALGDLEAGLLICEGKALSITRDGDRILIWNDRSRRVVQLPQGKGKLQDAAQSFADFFDGVVVDPEA